MIVSLLFCWFKLCRLKTERKTTCIGKCHILPVQTPVNTSKFRNSFQITVPSYSEFNYPINFLKYVSIFYAVFTLTLLYSYSHTTVRILSHYCTDTLTLLYGYSHTIVLILSHYCTDTLTLLYGYSHTVVCILSHCRMDTLLNGYSHTTVLILSHYCTDTLTLLYWYSHTIVRIFSHYSTHPSKIYCKHSKRAVAKSLSSGIDLLYASVWFHGG